MYEVRIGLPPRAKAGIALAAIGGVAVISWLLWMFIFLRDVGVALYPEEVFILGYLFVCGILFVVGAALAAYRRYLAGGVIVIIFAVNALFLVYLVWELLIAVVVALAGGALIALARERAQPSVLNVMRLYRRMTLSDLARKLSTDEATVELAVVELRGQGHPVVFVPETREVVYAPPAPGPGRGP